jgi:hypothetical protein
MGLGLFQRNDEIDATRGSFDVVEGDGDIGSLGQDYINILVRHML